MQYTIIHLQWARDLGALSDTPVNIPLHSTMHYYIITKPLEGMPNIKFLLYQCVS